MRELAAKSWLALMVGNSRLHWGWFVDSRLEQTWDTPHGDPAVMPDPLRNLMLAQLPLWIASVVPAQTALWQSYPLAQVITLEQVPLQGLYSTLGIDRALALWGAAKHLGFPTLVIDAGTALTFTGATAAGAFAGGAILPGLSLQMRSLAEQTAALPTLDATALASLPQRWASNTPDAIHSGILYTLLAGLQDFITAWQRQQGEGAIVLTGGDSELLFRYLQDQHPELASKTTVDPHVILWGIRAIVAHQSSLPLTNPVD